MLGPEYVQERAGILWRRYRDTRKRGGVCFCVACRKRLAIAHHPDYSKPLEIVWLCRKCHIKAHMGLLDISRYGRTSLRTT